jgi:peptidoglycan/xylan/chitin deacetylase (PgdA/CDA1 family)
MAAQKEDIVVRIAPVMHEAVRAWQKANGQEPAPPWLRAPGWMKNATYEAVAWRLANPKAAPSAQHVQWLAQKRAAGWTYGRTKNGVKKTHPLMVPYADLPDVERRKDALVAAIIDSLSKQMR